MPVPITKNLPSSQINPPTSIFLVKWSNEPKNGENLWEDLKKIEVLQFQLPSTSTSTSSVWILNEFSVLFFLCPVLRLWPVRTDCDHSSKAGSLPIKFQIFQKASRFYRKPHFAKSDQQLQQRQQRQQRQRGELFEAKPSDRAISKCYSNSGRTLCSVALLL